MSGRNVINVAALDAYLEDIAGDCAYAVTEGWLCRNARRWALANYDHIWHVAREPMTDRLVLIDPDDPDRVVGAYEDDVPDWAIRCLASGETLLYLRLNQTLTKRLRRIVAWVEGTADPQAGPKVERLSFADADRQAARWWREKHQRLIWPPGVVPVFTHGSDTIVKLTSARALEEEGDAMSHCVGDYAWEVEEGLSEIYSLRDTEGEPQATVEVNPSERYVLQVKGPANGPVASLHRPALHAFIGRNGWRIVDDHHNIALRHDPLDGDFDALATFLLSEAAEETFRDLRLVETSEFYFGRVGRFFARIERDIAHFEEHVRRRVFELVMPAGAPIGFRPQQAFWVYDEVWPVLNVCLPLPLLQLDCSYSFFELEVGPEVDAVRRRIEGMLPMLLFREPDRVFDLGPLELPDWTLRNVDHGPAAFFTGGNIEAEDLRTDRHTRIRQRMNAAKRRVAGKWARRSDGHETIRQTLAGETGRYVV